jgi:hypothetical protein
LTNQREANKIGFAMQAGATGIDAATRAPLLRRLSNGKMIFDGQTVFGACSKTVSQKEIPDGLSVLFHTRDVEPF